MQLRFISLSILLFASSKAALAQDAGSLLRDRQQTPNVKLPEQKPEASQRTPANKAGVNAQAEQTVLVQSLILIGGTDLLTDEQRETLSTQIEGQNVSFAELSALADEANAMLRQNGHLLARAIIPPQDATDGNLALEISEGQLEDISTVFEEGVRIRAGVIQSYVDRWIDEDGLRKSDLETALLRIGDLPGVSARSRLAAGQRTGTSKLVIDVAEEPVFSGAIFGDNFGSPSTGKAQGHAQLTVADITGIGDFSRFGFSLSEGQRFASASLSVPITASGLSASIDYSYLSYENQDALGQAAGLDGHAHYGRFGLNYQAVRTRNANLRFSAAINGKALVDDSAAGRLADKRIISGTVGFTGDVIDNLLGGSVTQFSMQWTRGDLDLSRLPTAEFFDLIGLRTQGKFHRINADMLRLQRLGKNFSLLARLSGQWASKNLDSSESFSLGGPYGVRGWPVGEGRGDMGITGTLELRYDLPTPPKAGAFQLQAFVDAGRVRINKNRNGIPSFNDCACNDYSLASAGVGISWQHKNFSLSASYSHGLGSNPGRNAINGNNFDGSNDRQQFWLSGSVRL